MLTMNRPQNCIRIYARPNGISVDISDDVASGAVPEALKETQNLRSLGDAVATCFA